MITEQLEEQAALYVLGCLSGEELHGFEAALSRDAELRRLVAGLRVAGEAVAGSAPLTKPSPTLKRRIMSELGPEKKIVSLPAKSPPQNNVISWLPWALAACV